MQDPQERVRTDWHTGPACQTSATFATRLQRKCCEQFGSAVRAAGITSESAIEPFGKDFAWAARHIAEAPTAMDAHARKSPLLPANQQEGGALQATITATWWTALLPMTRPVHYAF